MHFRRTPSGWGFGGWTEGVDRVPIGLGFESEGVGEVRVGGGWGWGWMWGLGWLAGVGWGMGGRGTRLGMRLANTQETFLNVSYIRLSPSSTSKGTFSPTGYFFTDTKKGSYRTPTYVCERNEKKTDTPKTGPIL